MGPKRSRFNEYHAYGDSLVRQRTYVYVRIRDDSLDVLYRFCDSDLKPTLKAHYSGIDNDSLKCKVWHLTYVSAFDANTACHALTFLSDGHVEHHNLQSTPERGRRLILIPELYVILPYGCSDGDGTYTHARVTHYLIGADGTSYGKWSPHSVFLHYMARMTEKSIEKDGIAIMYYMVSYRSASASRLYDTYALHLPRSISFDMLLQITNEECCHTFHDGADDFVQRVAAPALQGHVWKMPLACETMDLQPVQWTANVLSVPDHVCTHVSSNTQRLFDGQGTPHIYDTYGSNGTHVYRIDYRHDKHHRPKPFTTEALNHIHQDVHNEDHNPYGGLLCRLPSVNRVRPVTCICFTPDGRSYLFAESREYRCYVTLTNNALNALKMVKSFFTSREETVHAVAEYQSLGVVCVTTLREVRPVSPHDNKPM
jgi:hypothetical protein